MRTLSINKRTRETMSRRKQKNKTKIEMKKKTIKQNIKRLTFVFPPKMWQFLNKAI